MTCSSCPISVRRWQLELYGWRKVAWLVRESRARKFLQVLFNNCEIIGNRFFFARIGANAKNTPGFFSSVADENPVDFKLVVARFTADKQKTFLEAPRNACLLAG